MHYTPRLPDEDVNIPKHSLIKECFELVVGTMLVVFVVYVALGAAVDLVVVRASPNFERALGKMMESQFKASAAHKGDEQKLQAILDRLVAVNGEGEFPLRLKVVENPDSNAFALPGGTIAVFSGLLTEMKSENELAMVLGHEIGHFSHRDHLRGLGRGVVFAFIATLFLGEDSSMAQALVGGLSAGEMRFSREQERTADEVGLVLIERLYGHVGGAKDFFAAQARKEHFSFIEKIFLSHPPSQDRIQYLEEMIRSRHYQELPTIPIQFGAKVSSLGTARMPAMPINSAWVFSGPARTA